MQSQVTLLSRPLLLALLSFSYALLAGGRVRAEEVTFHLLPCLSSVDMTAFGYVDNEFFFTGPTTTRDTQTIPLGGTVTLDVTVADGVVQSVDFVSLGFNYLVNPDEPTVHKRIFLRDSSEGIPKGTEVEVHLPFDEEKAAGNPVTRFAPSLTLNGVGTGVETGVGNGLQVTEPTFRFEGSGQYFNLPTDPEETPFVDGWPMDYGPYPSPAQTPFPSMMPGEDYIPGVPPNTTMTPAPAGPDSFEGTVSLVNDALIFRGSLFSKGVGGAGILQTAQIHEATVVASSTPVLPGDYNDDKGVDAIDYAVWRESLGAPAGSLLNDIDGGEISQAHFLTWRSCYGARLETQGVSDPSSPAPEPSGFVLLACLASLASWSPRSMRL